MFSSYLKDVDLSFITVKLFNSVNKHPFQVTDFFFMQRREIISIFNVFFPRWKKCVLNSMHINLLYDLVHSIQLPTHFKNCRINSTPIHLSISVFVFVYLHLCSLSLCPFKVCGELIPVRHYAWLLLSPIFLRMGSKQKQGKKVFGPR